MTYYLPSLPSLRQKALQTIKALLPAILMVYLPIDAAAQKVETRSHCDFLTVDRAATETLHVGYFLFPPYTTKDRKGEPKGAWPTYMKTLMTSSGINHTEGLYPAKRLASELFSGKVHVSIIANNILLAAGEDKLSFLPDSLTQIRSGLVSAKHSPIYSIDAITGRTLGVNRGYGYGGLIHELMKPELQLSLWPADSELQLMKLLKSRRLEAAILYESMLQEPHPDWNIDASGLHFEPLSNTNFFIALSRKAPGLEELQRVLSHNMKLISQSSQPSSC